MAIDSTDISKNIFSITASQFEDTALAIFRYQYLHNKIYQQFCALLKKNTDNVNHIKDIPFLPIQFFKTKEVCSTAFKPEIIFESSGTTGSINSKHFVKSVAVYEESFLKAFGFFFGNVNDFCVIGLLPSYLERQHSSLVYMVNELIKKSANPKSGFYLYNYDDLKATLLKNEKAKQQTLLIGVTYALLDFAEQNNMNLQHAIVMETGGMKGRRAELTRETVHQILKQRLGINEVNSEYGMTELLSQAYAKQNGIFNCPPWMQVFIRAADDPFDLTNSTNVKTEFVAGGINIIDLANINSCSFIATDDIGKLYANNSFEVIGRLDNSDIRGCGLMIT
jgi:hypothetical protein